MTTIVGGIGIVVVISTVSEARNVLSISAGAFVLSVGGLVTLSGSFVGVPRDTTLVPAARTQSLGIVGGYLVAAVGTGLLVTSVSIMTIQGDSSSTLGASVTSEKAPAPPSTQSPATEPTGTYKQTASNPSPSEVVESYYESINDHDYRKAWELGGKNLNSASERREWARRDLNPHVLSDTRT